METKKISLMFIALMVLFSFSLNVYALENTTINTTITDQVQVPTSNVTNSTTNLTTEVVNNTNEEVILSDKTGIQIRFLQLNKAIQAQINGGNTIIENLKNRSVNESIILELETIINKFEDLSNQINATDYNQSIDTLVSNFITDKNIAIELSKEFRDIVHKNVNKEELENLRKKYQERKERILKRKNMRLERLRERFNSRLMERRLERFGKVNPKLLEKIKKENMSAKEMRQLLIKEYRSLPVKERKKVREEFRSELKEKNSHNNIRLERARAEFMWYKNNYKNELQKLQRLNNSDLKKLREMNRKEKREFLRKRFNQMNNEGKNRYHFLENRADEMNKYMKNHNLTAEQKAEMKRLQKRFMKDFNSNHLKTESNVSSK